MINRPDVEQEGWEERRHQMNESIFFTLRARTHHRNESAQYLGVYKTVRLLIKPSSFLPHSRTESCKSCQQRPLSACLSGLSMNQSSSLGYRPSLLVPASAMEPVPSAVVIGNDHPHEAVMISVDCDE